MIVSSNSSYACFKRSFISEKVRRSKGRCRDLMSKELLMGFYF